MVGHGQVPHLKVEVVASLGRGSGIALLALSAGSLGAKRVDGAAVGLGEQVGPQRAPVGIEALGMLPEPQEDLLDHVLGLGRVPQHPAGQAVGAAGVAAVGLGQSIVVPPSDGHDQGGVAGIAEVL